jgi:spermidine synthase
MTRFERKLLFALFFLSGFCGLTYQVVWVRLALASFGVITPVLSIVISVFMLGLFAGSWLAGKTAGAFVSRTRLSAIWLYALAEVLIAAGAIAVPRLLASGVVCLLRAGESDSSAYLLSSSVILAGAILPWCICMGATFPWMMAYVKQRDRREGASFSFLYLANVIGAMAGTLVTAVVAVEMLGFKRTLLVAATVNVCIAVAAAALGVRHRKNVEQVAAPVIPPRAAAPRRARARILQATLFITGFTSMAMEVAWTRAFTAVLATQVYSFAALLFGYLFGTWIGSLVYRRHLAAGRVTPTAHLVAALAAAATLPIIVNDPRLHLHIAGVFLGILPFCALLGYLTPKLIDTYSQGDPDAAGFSYALNVLGCVLGPLCASYALLPLLGVKLTLLLLAAPYAVLLALRTPRQAVAVSALFLVALLFNKTYEDEVQGFRGQGMVRRDHTATVIAYGHGMEKRLLVNGVGMTHLTTITKVMAHLPLAVTARPTAALAICFGMGTTFRSLLTWDIHATAVELIPSVKDTFPYFFDDAKDVLARREGKIVVDDGRRFLLRTSNTFDVITLDPPPPVEAAASSLLYSEEFYAAAKARLRPGGILQQWVPNTETRVVQAVARSLLDSFPYVQMYRSFEGPGLEESGFGYHFLASMQRIDVPAPEILAARMPQRAQADLVEWLQDKDAARFLHAVLEHELNPREFVLGSDARITDDLPFNEYYLLRRLFHPVRPTPGSAAQVAVEVHHDVESRSAP